MCELFGRVVGNVFGQVPQHIVKRAAFQQDADGAVGQLRGDVGRTGIVKVFAVVRIPIFDLFFRKQIDFGGGGILRPSVFIHIKPAVDFAQMRHQFVEIGVNFHRISFLGGLLRVQLQVAVFNPTDAAHGDGNQPSQKRGQHEMQ